MLFDETGSVVALAQQEFRQHFPQPGWVEHDALEIWGSVRATFRDCIARAGISAGEISAIGITNQRETTVVWDRQTGQPVCHAIVWQSRQSLSICEEIKANGQEPLIREKTGLVADAYFSASKIAWILRNVPGTREKAERGRLAFGTIDTWLLWNLTGGAVHATDYSNASRTLLYNIHELCWDEELLALFDIPASLLPEVKNSSGTFGNTLAEITGVSLPVCGIAGDQQAALFGQGCVEAGMAKNTYGTGCFMLMNTGREAVRPGHGLLGTIAWGLDGEVQYALEGSVFVAGSAVQWLRDGIGLFASAGETEGLAAAVSSTAGVYFVPAFVGLGAPYWDPDARGAFFGLTRGTTKHHIVRAALEAMAYQVKDVFEAMKAGPGIALQRLRVDGGGARNNLMMQFQSDILRVETDRPQQTETTALGAALLAGLAVGVWPDVASCAAVRKSDRIFRPERSETECLQLYKGWQQAVKATMMFKHREGAPI